MEVFKKPLKDLLQKLQAPLISAGDFDAVELTEEEQQFALRSAKADKFYRLQELEQREAKILKMRELARPWTFDEMKEAALRRANYLAQLSGHAAYILDEHTTPVFMQLCEYFTGDKAFEKQGRSLNKGILLVGNVGVGKTDLLRAFEFNRVRCFVSITCSEISAMVDDKGAHFCTTYNGYVPGHGATESYFNQPHIGWMFDDLGTEEPVNDYGHKVDPLVNIILERYKQKERVPFNSLHLTTNMNAEMIVQRYDLRILSRIREMFNIIQLEGSDRRV